MTFGCSDLLTRPVSPAIMPSRKPRATMSVFVFRAVEFILFIVHDSS